MAYHAVDRHGGKYGPDGKQYNPASVSSIPSRCCNPLTKRSCSERHYSRVRHNCHDRQSVGRALHALHERLPALVVGVQ